MKKLLVAIALVALIAAGALVWRADPLRAAPEPRIALVIGNADYGPDIGSLKNPPNDARLIAKALNSAGFDVDPQFNRTRGQMREDIQRFAHRLRNGGANAVGFFYFAGHGFQHSGENYLVPIGAQYKSLADAEDQSVRANYVFDQVLDARNRLNIVILDACRNNLFSRSRGPRGLVAVKAPSNVAVGYATAPGETADDGPPGGNSPYAAVLGAQISSSSERLETVMVELKRQVLAKTGKQEPYHDLNFGQEFRFQPEPPPPPPASARNLQPGVSFSDDCPQCPELVVLPRGSYLGVSFNSFAVGKLKVRRAEWNGCVNNGGCAGLRHDGPNMPVVDVTWHEAVAYTEWLSKVAGRKYRLLSEAEWEYAANAGQATTGGVKLSSFGDAKAPRATWEWTADCWNREPVWKNADPLMSGKCDQRVVRAIGSRRNLPATEGRINIGFRVATSALLPAKKSRADGRATP